MLQYKLCYRLYIFEYFDGSCKLLCGTTYRNIAVMKFKFLLVEMNKKWGPLAGQKS